MKPVAGVLATLPILDRLATECQPVAIAQMCGRGFGEDRVPLAIRQEAQRAVHPSSRKAESLWEWEP